MHFRHLTAEALKENTTLQQLGVASHELGQNLGKKELGEWDDLGIPYPMTDPWDEPHIYASKIIQM